MSLAAIVVVAAISGVMGSVVADICILLIKIIYRRLKNV